jgi:cytochrome c-type biogenesis protein CcmH
VVAGDSDEQARDFVVARYGNFVLLKPPMQLNTLALWVGPAFFVVVAAIGFGWHLRRRLTDPATQTPTSLTAAEQERIDKLLSEGNPT